MRMSKTEPGVWLYEDEEESEVDDDVDVGTFNGVTDSQLTGTVTDSQLVTTSGETGTGTA